jgi:hypothetical protein
MKGLVNMGWMGVVSLYDTLIFVADSEILITGTGLKDCSLASSNAWTLDIALTH